MTPKAERMNRPLGRRSRRLAALLSCAARAAGVGVSTPFMASGNAGSPHANGLFCTKDSSVAHHPVFDLTAKDGHIGLPDGSTAYMWGYTTGYSHETGEVQRGVEGEFQHPGPVLCVTEGDTVTIVLHNTLKYDDVSIVFPGQHGVTADGAPVQPATSGGATTSLAPAAAKGGGTVTYQFVADHAGTFLYESGTNPQVQVRMGLFGALIVRPDDDTATVRSLFGQGAGDPETRYRPESEYLGLLSEIDPYLNQRMETNTAKLDANPSATVTPFNLDNYHPRYWLINGRGFPDSIADNFAEWLPAQPYGALAEIQPKSATNPFPSLDRYLSVGSQDYPFHPHGNDARIVGRDGHPVVSASGEELGFDKFSIPVGPGQTWDATFEWQDAEQYSPSNPIPTTDPSIQNLSLGTFYSGSPYLGVQGPLPPGSSTQNECGEYYIIAHNHALQQITSWGVNMTGPITYTRVNPPNGTCS